MKTRIVLLTLLTLAVFTVKSQSRYNFIYQQPMDMNSTSENINAGLHLFDYMDSLFIPKKIIKLDNNAAKIVNPLYRLSKLFLTNYILTDLIMTMNHERYGHGYRILEAGGEITEIVYNPPPPFTYEFSYISWKENSNHTVQQELGVRLGGSEANLVLSDLFRKNILLDERFSYNYALPYLYGSNDAPGYTAFVSNPGSDPNQYRRIINEFYGGENLTEERMKAYSLLALFTDPMNFYAIKSVFYNYLIKGEHSSKVGMIKFSDRIKYLPRFRFIYTPYGPELMLQNYLKFDKKLFQFSYSHSDGTFETSWRLIAEAWNIHATEKISFNFKGQIWDQPAIDFFVNDKPLNSSGLGGQFLVTTNYDFISKTHTLGATVQVGYKTKGYALGERLDEGLVIGGGLTYRLGNSH